MRAVVCREWGGLEKLKIEEMPEPEPGAGEVVIGVKVSTVNFADSLMIKGQYQTKPEFPFSPGLEASGVVLRRGPGARLFAPGDRVMAMLAHGGFAEQAVAREADTFKLPERMSFEAGGSFLTAYVSSHVALRWQGHLEQGESLLVLGAAGGVGLTAVEIGKAMGAKVIAGASSDERLQIARAHGADEAINYQTEHLRDRVMELTDGKGVDVCYDPVGGQLFDQALSSLGWGGRILLIGFVGGIPQIPANRLLVKHRAALGSSLRYFRFHAPEKLRRSVDELVEWYLQGKLRPLVTASYPLERAADAIRSLTERRATGKVVVTVDSGGE